MLIVLYSTLMFDIARNYIAMANAQISRTPPESVYIEEETRVVSAVFALQGDT